MCRTAENQPLLDEPPAKYKTWNSHDVPHGRESTAPVRAPGEVQERR
jgi:hypothetical protein